MSTTFHGTQAKFAMKASNPAYTDADQVQTFSIEEGAEILELYEIGDRKPVELKEGKISISGSISRYFEAGNFSAAGKSLQGLCDGGDEMDGALYPEGDASPEIKVTDLKLSRWRIEGGVDGMVMESADYRGLAIAVS